MGCDIHIYTETLNKETNIWTNCDLYTRNGDGDLFRHEWYQGRYYELFMLLAHGVRGDVPWGRELQGFPDDASTDAKEAYAEWDCDAHSPSWITLNDLIIYTTQIQMNNKPTLGGKEALAEFVNDWTFFMLKYNSWIKYIVPVGGNMYTDNTEWKEYVRLVYWFDN